jgi:Aldo/keto reductase family
MTMNLTLNNGVQMPALGFGVFQTPPDVTAQAVSTALATGYRLIDTAAAYGNEREVGQAIRHSGLARDDVFIETKIWISDYGYGQTLHAFGKSAGKLGVDRIDLLILHQALPARFDLTQEAYRALETLLGDGRVRAIGVSNFMPGHLDALLKQATVVPAVNQVEVHPYFAQPAVQAADAAHGHPHPGLVADRRHHQLPRYRDQHVRRPGHRLDRRRPCQDPGTGDDPLALAARALRDPEVGAARPDRRELRRVRLRAHHRRAQSPGRTRHRRARRA